MKKMLPSYHSEHRQKQTSYPNKNKGVGIGDNTNSSLEKRGIWPAQVLLQNL